MDDRGEGRARPVAAAVALLLCGVACCLLATHPPAPALLLAANPPAVMRAVANPAPQAARLTSHPRSPLSVPALPLGHLEANVASHEAGPGWPAGSASAAAAWVVAGGAALALGCLVAWRRARDPPALALLSASGQRRARPSPPEEPRTPASATSEELLEACRVNDAPRIQAEIQRLRTGAALISGDLDLRKTWQLVCSESTEVLQSLGSGKPLLNNEKVIDAFLVLKKGEVRWVQAARRIGPYPNQMYTFTGEWKAENLNELRITWKRYEVSGSDKYVEGLRRFAVEVLYVDSRALILQLPKGVLVFEACGDMEEQLAALRVIKKPGEDSNPLAAVANLFRFK